MFFFPELKRREEKGQTETQTLNLPTRAHSLNHRVTELLGPSYCMEYLQHPWVQKTSGWIRTQDLKAKTATQGSGSLAIFIFQWWNNGWSQLNDKMLLLRFSPDSAPLATLRSRYLASSHRGAVPDSASCRMYLPIFRGLAGKRKIGQDKIKTHHQTQHRWRLTDTLWGIASGSCLHTLCRQISIPAKIFKGGGASMLVYVFTKAFESVSRVTTCIKKNALDY